LSWATFLEIELEVGSLLPERVVSEKPESKRRSRQNRWRKKLGRDLVSEEDGSSPNPMGSS
jgi:hypothetical protein